MDVFDFIVVGAGSAGCVLAERLSADGLARVLVLEAGGSDRRFWIRTPIGYGKAFHDPRVNWRYSAEPEAGLGGRRPYLPRGRVIGGSSSINAMVYCRGLPADYDDWRDAGNPGWGWSDVEPLFRSFESRLRADGSRVGEGPLWVADREREFHPVRRHLYAAARELGMAEGVDLNGEAPEGVGPYPTTTRRGLRWSAADAFLHPARQRSNLAVRTGALARRVIFEGRTACGIEYVDRGGIHQARARREVILAAGAINAPQLLQLSGIGPGEVLQRAGVAVLHASPGVGTRLSDHLGIDYVYRATEPTLNGVLGSWSGRITSGIRFLLARSGPLSLSVNQMGGLVRSSPEQPRPNIQLYFNPLSYSIKHAGKRPLLEPDPHPGFIIGFNPCRPTSTGRVEITSPDPAAAPRITMNYLATNHDIAEAVAGARVVGRFQATGAMRALIDGAPTLDLLKASDAEIERDFRARCGTVHHVCGTCRMAPEHAGGVVDSRLRVHGVDRLRVVDASIFPNITSANTNAPTIMVAHMAARFLAAA